MSSKETQRPLWSSRLAALRGLAIVLVVLGHMRPDSGSESWLTLRRVIFDIHVPIFFVVAGALWGVGQRSASTSGGWRWLPRLLVPLVAFTAIPFAAVLLGRLLFGDVGWLPPLDAQRLVEHCLNPQRGGFAVHLWFLMALLVVRLAHPLMRLALRSDVAVLAAAIIISMAPLPGTFCLRLAALHLPLYAAGVLLGRGRLQEVTLRRGWLWALGAAGLYAALYSLPRIGPVRLVLGLCGVVVLWELTRLLRGRLRAALVSLGDRSLEVYLLHPLFVPVALALAALAGSGWLSWFIWLSCGAVTLLGSWALVRGVDAVPGATTILFGRPLTMKAGRIFGRFVESPRRRG